MTLALPILLFNCSNVSAILLDLCENLERLRHFSNTLDMYDAFFILSRTQN